MLQILQVSITDLALEIRYELVNLQNEDLLFYTHPFCILGGSPGVVLSPPLFAWLDDSATLKLSSFVPMVPRELDPINPIDCLATLLRPNEKWVGEVQLKLPITQTRPYDLQQTPDVVLQVTEMTLTIGYAFRKDCPFIQVTFDGVGFYHAPWSCSVRHQSFVFADIRSYSVPVRVNPSIMEK